MYSILYYRDLDCKELKLEFSKIIEFLGNGNFESAKVAKLKFTKFFSAKLDETNRLLFTPVKYNNQFYFLILEIIKNNEYEKSRFLKEIKIVEEDVTLCISKEIEDAESLKYINENYPIHLLNKFIVFDPKQTDVFQCHLPLILIGSAGSGKTSVMLEKLKTLKGRILYISLSSYLVHNARKLYFSYNYENDEQYIDFLSFKEFLETIQIPKEKEITEKIFCQWIIIRS